MPVRSSFFDQLDRLHRDGLRFFEWCTVRIASSAAPQPKKHLEIGAILEQAFREGTAAYVRDRRFEEADHLAERGLAALPDCRELLIHYAFSAQDAGRFAAAVDRWRQALQVASDLAICHAGLAANLREMGDHNRAQVAIDEGLRLFPHDIAVVTEAARVAAARGHYRASLQFWQQAIETPQPHADWLRGHAQALLHLREFQDAEAVLNRALADFPDDSGLKSLHVSLASARAEGSESVPSSIEETAASRDEAAREASPALLMTRVSYDSGVAEMAPPLHPEPVQTVEDEAVKQLLLRFESLGDTREFGFVQRRYAAEPLGLLRWNSVTFDQLVQALEHRLAGMGEATNTHIAVAPDGEYCMHDRRWSLGMHTFLYEGETNRDALYKRMCRRITYLRDKFLSDLVEAEKIFVYASLDLDERRLQLLHRALRVSGPVKMLAVQPAMASAAFQGSAGDVLKIDDDRYVGFLRWAGRDADGSWNIAFDDWVRICRKAAEAMSPGCLHEETVGGSGGS